ncbi:MAG TPA: S8 family serine peptidase [Bryobacteraceae bacterium]|nr:S8 family serine peptidase [Bryobacteraceae bacterium]
MNALSWTPTETRTIRRTRTAAGYSTLRATALEPSASSPVARYRSSGDRCLGGCPHADILPLRIANSVVMFFTSNFAKAVQYAIQQRGDVISISMGGLPSSAWNDAAKAAYEAGICIVATSGNCFGGLPSHRVVYPARHRRTIAASL